MKLNELVAGFARCGSSLDITGIATDSRDVKSGYAFVALNDGTQYISQAIVAGAAVIIFDAQINSSNFKNLAGFAATLFIGINNLAENIAEIAARYYGYPSQHLQIIGITGTNGKTSCSQFLAQALTDAMVIGTLGWGTWGNVQFTGYTTPDVLLLQKILAETVKQGKKTVVMEVSSHGVQENRIAQTRFKGAVFTNLSRDHLDYHGTMAEYFQAKLQFFKRSELEFAVINADDEYGQRIIEELNSNVRLWQFRTGSPLKDYPSSRTVQAQNIHCSHTGIQFQVCCDNESALINSHLYGEFNVENMLAVLTTLLALGFDLATAAEKISALQSVTGRMEYFGGDNQPAVFVDFAHTPDALEKVLHTLKQHQPKSFTVVFGCGGNRDAGKRPLMGAIAEKLADKVIITDDNPRFEAGDTIVADILAGCEKQNITVIRDRALAIQTAIAQASAGDCVVIAGKGHEDYQDIKGVKTPFSDQDVVKKALELWTE